MTSTQALLRLWQAREKQYFAAFSNLGSFACAFERRIKAPSKVGSELQRLTRDLPNISDEVSAAQANMGDTVARVGRYRELVISLEAYIYDLERQLGAPTPTGTMWRILKMCFGDEITDEQLSMDNKEVLLREKELSQARVRHYRGLFSNLEAYIRDLERRLGQQKPINITDMDQMIETCVKDHMRSAQACMDYDDWETRLLQTRVKQYRDLFSKLEACIHNLERQLRAPTQTGNMYRILIMCVIDESSTTFDSIGNTTHPDASQRAPTSPRTNDTIIVAGASFQFRKTPVPYEAMNNRRHRIAPLPLLVARYLQSRRKGNRMYPLQGPGVTRPRR